MSVLLGMSFLFVALWAPYYRHEFFRVSRYKFCQSRSNRGHNWEERNVRIIFEYFQGQLLWGGVVVGCMTDMWKTFSFTHWTPFCIFLSKLVFPKLMSGINPFTAPAHTSSRLKSAHKGLQMENDPCLLGGSGGVVNSLDFCLALLESLHYFYSLLQASFQHIVHLMQIGLLHAETNCTKRISHLTLFLLPCMWCSCQHSSEGVNLFLQKFWSSFLSMGYAVNQPWLPACSVPLLTC